MCAQAPDTSPARPLGSVVLLTACIRPGAVVALSRSDPTVRLEDYRRALAKWIRVREIDGVVFCENTGADLSSLEAMVPRASGSCPEVEFLSFHGQDFDPSFGKGYGEMGIIRHAVDNSDLLARSRIVIKVTGRLFVPNIARLARSAFESEGVDLVCDLRRNMTSADSRVFCATRRFLQDYLLPYSNIVNDSQGVYFENALARAAHRAMADGRLCAFPPRPHRMEGVAGTNNEMIPSGWINHAERALFLWLKALVLRR
jgi:hypothetical protein